MSTGLAAPVSQSERIVILDSLRGIAILGILLMNIPSFALPGTGHDPSILNEAGTINLKSGILLIGFRQELNGHYFLCCSELVSFFL